MDRIPFNLTLQAKMDALRAQLHDTYTSKETGDLLALGVRPGLHEHEYATIESVLSVRGVDISAVQEQRRQRVRTAVVADTKDEKLAGVSKRVIAQFIDTVGVALLLALLGLLITVTMPNLFKQTNRVILILWLLYLLFKDGFDGQSLGKRVMKIRVVHADTEHPCSLQQSLLRNLAVLTVVDWAFALGRKQLRLGDMLARTKVVRE